MAHAGKDYKLWFRRDASVLVNNYRGGFPEAFKVLLMGSQSSARYAVSLLPTVMAINLKKNFDPTWESPQVGGLFDNCSWQVTLPILPVLSQSIITVRYTHHAIINTPLFHADFVVGFPFGFYPQWRRGGLKQLHFLSPDISLNPDNYLFHIQAARWSEYNP